MKRYISLLLAAAMILTLAACGGGSAPAESAATKATEKAPETTAATEAATTTAPAPETTTAAPKAEPVTIYVAASPQDKNGWALWEQVKEDLAGDGIELELRDYNLSNMMDAVISSESDICAGASPLTLKRQYGEERVCPVGYLTCSPYHLYSAKYSSAEEIIASGEYVALYEPWAYGQILFNVRLQTFLESIGLIELPNGPGTDLKVDEVKELVEFYPVPYQNMPDEIDTVAAFVTPGSVGDLEPIGTDITFEDPDNWSVLLASPNSVKDPAKLDAIEKIVEAYQTRLSEQLAANGSASEPVGMDIDLIAQYR